MKLNKKKLIVSAVALCLIAILSMGTLAWFSAEDEVVNDFMIATSTDTKPEDIFSIDVVEITPDGENDTDEYTYEDILPGDVLKKEVTVKNTGYYDQYVRVTVTVSDAAAWIAAMNNTVPGLGSIVNGYDSNNWIGGSRVHDTNADTIIYTLYYNGILQGEIQNGYDSNASTIIVFTDVKIPETMTVDQAAAFKNNFQITIKADAVQTENLKLNGQPVVNAIEAFEVVEG